MSNTCSNCNYYSPDLVKDNEVKQGYCTNKFWVINPNYYETSDKPMKQDGARVTYNPIVGADFGCIHFFAKHLREIAISVGIPASFLDVNND